MSEATVAQRILDLTAEHARAIEVELWSTQYVTNATRPPAEIAGELERELAAR